MVNTISILKGFLTTFFGILFLSHLIFGVLYFISSTGNDNEISYSSGKSSLSSKIKTIDKQESGTLRANIRKNILSDNGVKAYKNVFLVGAGCFGVALGILVAFIIYFDDKKKHLEANPCKSKK